MRRVSIICALLLGLVACQPQPQWRAPAFADDPNVHFVSHWQRLQERFIDAQGRVIDSSSEALITTSEGQAYGLFFALVSNDPAQFEALLRWTENNLAQGDLTAYLPAWLWGQREQDWGVIDVNPASDADIIIAYTLIEAGRLWQQPRYSALGRVIADRILQQETLERQGQLLLLPAPYGFGDETGDVRLNLSYYAFPMLTGLASYHDARWRDVYQSGYWLAAQHPYWPSDWIQVSTDLQLTDAQEIWGDYDAIRYYLWAALDPQLTSSAINSELLLQYLRENGYPPQRWQWQQGNAEGIGPIGFSATILPYLERWHPELSATQFNRIAAIAPERYADNYYDTMLLLFGLGAQTCFRFDQQGQLAVNWTAPYCVEQD